MNCGSGKPLGIGCEIIGDEPSENKTVTSGPESRNAWLGYVLPINAMRGQNNIYILLLSSICTHT